MSKKNKNKAIETVEPEEPVKEAPFGVPLPKVPEPALENNSCAHEFKYCGGFLRCRKCGKRA